MKKLWEEFNSIIPQTESQMRPPQRYDYEHLLILREDIGKVSGVCEHPWSLDRLLNGLRAHLAQGPPWA